MNEAKQKKRIIFCAFFCLFIGTHTHGDRTNHELFENKKILILGGTGFLGRALTHELLKYNPAKIYIFSRDEVKHFHCATLFKDHPAVTMVLGDIRDYPSMCAATRGIDIVFHTAAYKRIDLLENNVSECIKTNIIGSLNVFNACIENNVPEVVFISTDKACSPANTYGASKFISEKIFTHYDKSHITTKFVVARYGNVLESTGSLIPIVIDKIKRGEDIPLTHEQMTRFLITKEDAIALIIDALRYGNGGEIFVKDLPASKIVDLLTYLRAHFKSTNKIYLSGIRPGEKIHESLINKGELNRTYYFKGYYIITPSFKQDNAHSTPPAYARHGTSMVTLPCGDEGYSSDRVVIPYHELEKLLTPVITESY